MVLFQKPLGLKNVFLWHKLAAGKIAGGLDYTIRHHLEVPKKERSGLADEAPLGNTQNTWDAPHLPSHPCSGFGDGGSQGGCC